MLVVNYSARRISYPATCKTLALPGFKFLQPFVNFCHYLHLFFTGTEGFTTEQDRELLSVIERQIKKRFVVGSQVAEQAILHDFAQQVCICLTLYLNHYHCHISISLVYGCHSWSLFPELRRAGKTKNYNHGKWNWLATCCSSIKDLISFAHKPIDCFISLLHSIQNVRNIGLYLPIYPMV